MIDAWFILKSHIITSDGVKIPTICYIPRVGSIQCIEYPTVEDRDAEYDIKVKEREK